MQKKMQLLEICFCKTCTFPEFAFFLHFFCFFFFCILPRFFAIFEKFEALTKPPPKNAKKMQFAFVLSFVFFSHFFLHFFRIFFAFFLHLVCILPRFFTIFKKIEALTKPPPKNAKKCKLHFFCILACIFFAFLFAFFFLLFFCTCILWLHFFCIFWLHFFHIFSSSWFSRISSSAYHIRLAAM